MRILDAATKLGKLERTAQGGARVPATLMRPGISTYYVKGRAVRHYTPPAVVAEAAASARDATVTYLHPREREVTPANFERESKGHVSGDAAVNDAGILQGMFVIQSLKLLDAIEQDIATEVSPGYDISVLDEPGVTPEGEAYDILRTKVRFNHFAVLPSGRQGKTVRLMLDSSGDSILEDTMTIMVDGAEVSADAVQGRIDGLVESNKGLKSQVEALTLQLNDAKDPAKLETLVSAAAALLVTQQAEEKRVNDEKVAKEAKDADNLAKAKVRFPKMVLDGKSADYIEGILANDADGTILMAGGSEGTPAPLPGADKIKVANDCVEELSPREYQQRQNQNLWTLPIPGAMTADGVVGAK